MSLFNKKFSLRPVHGIQYSGPGSQYVGGKGSGDVDLLDTGFGYLTGGAWDPGGSGWTQQSPEDFLEDVWTYWHTGGVIDYETGEEIYSDIEDSVKELIEDVFPSLDEASILALSELNIEFMGMEHDENVRRLNAQFKDELGYVKAVQASSGLSLSSSSFESDREARESAFKAEKAWMKTALEKKVEITRAETLKEIDILDQQLTSQNINTGLNILDTVL